jgi:hypothetical protein
MAEDTKDEAALREIPASEILDKIQKGERVEYDHVKIVGNLNQIKLNLPIENIARSKKWYNIKGVPSKCKIISSSIKINNSKIEGLDFRDCLFRDQTDFKNNEFSGTVNIDGAMFAEITYFDNTIFNESASL